MISPLRSILGLVALLLTAALGSAYAQSTEPATPPATPPPTTAPTPPATPPATQPTTPPAPPAASEKPAPAPASGNTIPVDLELHAGIRYRWEIDGRAKFDENASNTEFSLLRSQLSVGVKLPKNVSLFVQGQDSRVWGEELSPEDGSAPRGDMHQGYFLAEDFGTPGAWLQIGRMEMVLGNERLVGDNDFSNTGRAFDAVVAGYYGSSYNFRIFESKINEGVGSVTRGKDRDFFGAFGSFQAAAEHAIDGYVLFDSDKDTLSTGEELFQHVTLGARGHGDISSSFGYDVEGAYQTGDAAGLDLSAYLFAARLSYTMTNEYQPAFGIGLDMLSGNDPDNADEIGVFNTLFADNHGFYGLGDFFVDIPRDTRGGGLTDFMIYGSITPSPRFSAQLQYHNFSATEEVRLAGSLEKLSAFGNEFDLIGDIPCTENVAVQIGGGLFMPGEIFEAALGDGMAYWTYLQTTVSY